MQKIRPHLKLFGVGLALVILCQVVNLVGVSTLETIAEKTSATLETKLRLMNKAVSEVPVNPLSTPSLVGESISDPTIGLYQFNKDSLVYWNNSQWDPGRDLGRFNNPTGFVKLRHGYFIYAVKKSGHHTTLALCLVKPLYPLQNNYLNNHFCDWLDVPENIGMDTSARAPIKITNQNVLLFGIKSDEENFYNTSSDNLCLLLFLAGVALMLAGLLLSVKNQPFHKNTIVSVACVVLVRFLMLYFKFPSFLYRTFLFDPRYFGNARSFLNGFLGDILLNAMFILFFAGALHFYAKSAIAGKRPYLVIILAACLTLFEFDQFNRIIRSLVDNSTLNYNFLSIFSLKPVVFAGLASCSIIALAVYLTLSVAVSGFGRSGLGMCGFFAVVLVLCFSESLMFTGNSFAIAFWPLVACLPVYFLKRTDSSGGALSLGIYVLIVSVVTTWCLNEYIDRNQALDLEVLMQKLGERQDEILESEFAGLPATVEKDENLINLINLLPSSEKEVELKLRQNYFNGYFNRYEINFLVFDRNCSPLLNNKNGVLLNEGFFEDRIRYFSTRVFNGLYFVNKQLNNTQYIARLDLGEYKLYALLEARHFEEVGSFPDLFLDQSLQKQNKLKAFNYAVYRAGQLTSRFGDLNYPFFYSDSVSLATSFPTFVHHYFEPEEGTKIIISQTAKDQSYFFTFNSYLLLFFSLLTYGSYLIYTFLFTKQFNTSSLTRRIQAIIIILLLVAMSAVGITSGRLITGQFNDENKKELEEKTSVIIHELARLTTTEQLFDVSQKDLHNGRLIEYSRLFNTPISLFNLQGMLFNTSEPKLYDFGLAAPFVNPVAYNQLSNNKNSMVSVNETAGNLNYTSLYTPLFDSQKKIVGFINLPYFARQSDLAGELSQIISALINVYVILFVLSILAGLILSGYITRPLRLIKQQLAKITLGSQNEKISWRSNDEIGKLVNEYNDMLVKLEESATLLAKSERESAWREMAKQVAHEIKNPLTPMKLNLQYLQHLMKNNPDDFKERFEKASAGIIEQIDTLATIATEFSNFAKLPTGILEEINLSEIINTAILMFHGQKNLNIENQIAHTNLLVKGDREQCLRVFNNLLKNAVQATEELENGRIEVFLSINDNKKVTVGVKDNGCGISKEMKPRIFSPNFTTKSNGSGLGLAMVKNIMEGFGGSIRFESEAGTGTVFYLEFLR